jgi:hypothetical protein
MRARRQRLRLHNDRSERPRARRALHADAPPVQSRLGTETLERRAPAALGELSRRDKRSKLRVLWPERAPASRERHRGQRTRGELTVGKLAPTPDQLNGQVPDRWPVSDQHRRVYLVRHATQALEQLGACRAISSRSIRISPRGATRSSVSPARRAEEHSTRATGICSRRMCALIRMAALRPRGASGRS